MRLVWGPEKASEDVGTGDYPGPDPATDASAARLMFNTGVLCVVLAAIWSLSSPQGPRGLVFCLGVSLVAFWIWTLVNLRIPDRWTTVGHVIAGIGLLASIVCGTETWKDLPPGPERDMAKVQTEQLEKDAPRNYRQ